VSPLKPTGPLPQLLQRAHLPIGFGALLIVTAAVRLVGVQRPLLGNFSAKNVVYAMIARNWAEGRASLWLPTLDCLRGGSRSLHLLEWPAAAYLTGWLWRTFGGSLDVWGRAVSVGFSVAAVAMLFLLIRRRHGRTAALAAGYVLALSPVAIVVGESFMLETSVVFFTLAVVYGLDRWRFTGRIAWLALAGVALALLLLTKIYMLVLLLPLVVMVLGKRNGERSRRERLSAMIVLAVAVLPAAVWYGYALRISAADHPLSATVFYSIRDSAGEHRPPHPLLFAPDFYRQLFDDLSTVVLTPVAFMLPLVGLLDRSWRRYAAWLAAMAILVVALPRKFYEMNYYYMVILPPLCIMAGLGWRRIVRRLRPGRIAIAAVLLLGLAASLRYAAKPAWITPEEDRQVLAAAAVVHALAAEDEPVVTMHGTAIDLLYYCDRPGWAVSPEAEDIESQLSECRRQGARYLVATGPAAQGLPALAKLPTAVQSDGFAVYRLVEGE
jgi:4-amino-4-deoxy-L-arabinose transferase-like glycosyltransferase